MTQDQGTHFWFMTIQKSQPHGGVRTMSVQGTITPQRGVTRLDVFNKLVAEVNERSPETIGGIPVFFDIQPNKL